MNNNLLNKLKTIKVITEKNQLNKKCSSIIEKYPDILDELILTTKFLDKNTPHKIRVYCLMNDITEASTCLVCNKPTQFNLTKKQFNQYCPNAKGSSCASKDKNLQERIKQTNIDRYGVDNPIKSKKIKERIKQTNIKKYGSTSPLKNKGIRKKIKETCIERYGTEYPTQHEDVKNKIKQTNIDRYGAPSYSQSLLPKESVELLEDKNWLHEQFIGMNKTKKIIAKELNVSIGVIRYYVKKYNLHKTKENIIDMNENYDSSLLRNKEWLVEHYSNKNLSSSFIGNLLNVDRSTVYKWRMKYNIERNDNVNSYASVEEDEIRSYIFNICENKNIETNSRNVINPYELDLYIPEMNFALEYCGVYWHSELNGRKDKKYHLRKLVQCQDKNIHLVQIWSSEWNSKQDIVKSRLSSLLQKNQIVHARKCTVKEITSKEAREFLDKTHIQGFYQGDTYLALIYDNEIVCVMTFGKSRFTKESCIELLRYSTKLFTNVIGGSNKLFQYYIKNYRPEKIVSYSDKRWNKGNMYKLLGFNFSHSSLPNYWYFNKNKDKNMLYSRVSFQKHKLPKLLDVFDPELTEWENMQLNNYDRIWDCGNDVFIWTP